MNNVTKGYCRDRQIVDAVEQAGALTTEQIAALLFRRLSTGHRKAQLRLQRLTEGGQLRRTRLAIGQPFAYHAGPKPKQLEHRLCVNWAYAWLVATMPSWERVVATEYERELGPLRADLLLVAENAFTKRLRVVCVEAERTSANRWDKVQRYSQMFIAESYRGEWWAERSEHFPDILCAAADGGRARAMREAVAEHNAHGLRFNVVTQEQLRREAWPWQL